MFTPFTDRNARIRNPKRRNLQPTLDGLESRLVLSAAGLAHHAHHAAAHAAAHVSTAAAPQVQSNVSVPISLSSIDLRNITRDISSSGALTLTATGNITGNILNHQFTTPATLTITQASSTATPVLNLHLDAIHLNLLGLKIDTSPICLDITAQPGGGLLGDLLGGSGALGGLLSGVTGSTNLNDLLGNLNTVLNSTTGGLAGTGQTGGLLGGLSAILNTATGQATTPTGRAARAPGGVTNLLHLSVGPVDLNLLGLNVHLDNCAKGPVTVDVSAQRGPGNLLGNLLTGVARLLEGPRSGATNPAQALLGLIENI